MQTWHGVYIVAYYNFSAKVEGVSAFADIICVVLWKTKDFIPSSLYPEWIKLVRKKEAHNRALLGRAWQQGIVAFETLGGILWILQNCSCVVV